MPEAPLLRLRHRDVEKSRLSRSVRLLQGCEDFEEADDSVLNKKITDDVGVQNNLMRNGTVNNDDVDLEDVE